MAADFCVNAERRPQARALHDFAAGPDVASQRADLQGIVNCVVAWADDHGMAGAKPELAGETREIGDEFQLALRVRFPSVKTPTGAAGGA